MKLWTCTFMNSISALNNNQMCDQQFYLVADRQNFFTNSSKLSANNSYTPLYIFCLCIHLLNNYNLQQDKKIHLTEKFSISRMSSLLSHSVWMGIPLKERWWPLQFRHTHSYYAIITTTDEWMVLASLQSTLRSSSVLCLWFTGLLYGCLSRSSLLHCH